MLWFLGFFFTPCFNISFNCLCDVCKKTGCLVYYDVLIINWTSFKVSKKLNLSNVSLLMYCNQKQGGRDRISPCPTCMGLNKDGCLHFWDKSQPLIPLPHLSLLSTRYMHSGLKDQGISPTHMNRQGLKCRNQHSHPHTHELIRELRHSQFQNT
jgi:hypothetical protein